MSGKWTPGPWEIRKYKDPYGRRNLAVEILTDEIIIAKLGIEIDEECAANAHIIAASPDMYEFLLYAVECISHGCMPGVAWLENARAALNKAGGVL